MKIGIVSDSHGSMGAVEAMLAHPAAKGVAAWLHAGDFAPDADALARLAGVPVYCVAGNGDWPSPRVKDEELVALAGHRILLAHGHTYGVQYGRERFAKAARQAGADIAVYGHTHCAENGMMDGVLVLNPGSVARPRDAMEGSFMTMELTEGNAPGVQLIRFEPR